MMDESVSERVDFFCALSVFVLERSFFPCLLERSYWQHSVRMC